MSFSSSELFKTYNTEYLEQHADSSDFECPSACTQSNKLSKKAVKKKKPRSKVDKELYERNIRKEQRYDGRLDHGQEKYDAKSVLRRTKSKYSFVTNFVRNLDLIPDNLTSDRDDSKDELSHYNVKPSASKWTILKQKISPCLSKIFSRSHKTDNKIEFQFNDQKFSFDNPSDMYCASCERKFDKPKNRTQPIFYAVEGNIQFPVKFGATKVMHVPFDSKSSKAIKKILGSNYSLTSLSADIVVKDKDKEKQLKKIRKHLKNCLKKEYSKRIAEISNDKHKNLQYPSLNECLPSTSSFQNQDLNVANSATVEEYFDGLHAESSVFWDDIFDQIHKKNQTVCCESQKPKEPPRRPCCRDCKIGSPRNQSSYKDLRPPPSPPREIKLSNMPRKPSPQAYNRNRKPKDCAECHCPRLKTRDNVAPMPKCESPRSLSKQGLKSGIPGGLDEAIGPCQHPHDQVKKAVQTKYNGEILCIHNPPCVLINGCLNFPINSQTQSTSIYPATTVRKSGVSYVYNNKSKSSKKKNNTMQCEQCKYSEQNDSLCPKSSVGVNFTNDDKEVQNNLDSFDATSYAVLKKSPYKYLEKEIETNPYQFLVKRDVSVCNVSSEKAGNYCVHVPMCPKLPECFIPRRSREYLRNNSELHICTKNYVEEPTRDNTSTQVRPKYKPKSESPCVHSLKCQRLPECAIKRYTRNESIDAINSRDMSSINNRNGISQFYSDYLAMTDEEIDCNRLESLCQMPLRQSITNDNNSAQSCYHTPKCPEIPMCRAAYVSLTPKETISTQVKPKSKMVCRHEPHCILLPNCVSYNVNEVCEVPECPHRPSCEMVPACCKRNTKGMVSEIHQEISRHLLAGPANKEKDKTSCNVTSCKRKMFRRKRKRVEGDKK